MNIRIGTILGSWMMVCFAQVVLAQQAPTADAPPAAEQAPAAEQVPAAEANEETVKLSPDEVLKSMGIEWQFGPTTGRLGNQAEIAVPEGFVFADRRGAQKFSEMNQNPITHKEQGMLAPKDLRWVIFFEFDPVGYVKDDDKEELDADAMLEAMQEGTKAGNEARKQRGWNTITLLGWKVPPRYDDQTNNLEWATILKDDTSGFETVNHNIRLLGREGVMEATVLMDPETYEASLAEGRKSLASFGFSAGNRYSEYVEGDRIAEYGLVGLVTGGALIAAGKMGWLTKLGKGAIKIVILIGAGIAALASRLFGRKKKNNIDT
ncbi:MAG: DUF2167 domain-containing protein [Myxococcales bacterium]|nr:DUF2167 domain-containing protein [Myxococcales bacterium]